MAQKMNNATYRSQKGVVTLITAVVLMLAVFGVSFYMSEVVIKEQQIIGNKYRGHQAFQSAQSGMDHGIAMILEGIVPSVALNSISSGTYSVTVSPASASDPFVVDVVAEGYAEDQSVKRVLSQRFGYLPTIPNPPSMPVVARGSVSITGNLSVTNNYSNITIWTGEEVSTWGSGNTYISVDGQPDQLSTTAHTRGPDVIDGDKNLSVLPTEDYMKNFLGMDWNDLWTKTKEEFRFQDEAAFDAYMTTHTESDLDGKLVYIKGDVTINGGIWGASSQTILVVDGELTTVGNVDLRGLIVAKSLVKGAGTPVIRGGIMVTDDVDFGAGNFSVIYEPFGGDPTDAPFDLGAVTSSWKDWE